MTVRAGARSKDRQGEPDPGHFERFCREIVPGVLTDVCHVDEELAAQVGKDILARAESYAALDDTARNVLISPFAEEVAGYEPADSSLDLKGAVSVVVRSSLLEEVRSHGPVEAGGIEGITTMAAAPLSHFLAARRRIAVTVKDNLFADLADVCPRAWSCLSAVALAYGADSGRWPYRVPAMPVPELPLAEVDAPPGRKTMRTRSSSAASIPGLISYSCSVCARPPRMVTLCGSLLHSAASRGTSASSCGLWSIYSPITCLS